MDEDDSDKLYVCHARVVINVLMESKEIIIIFFL